METLKEQGFTLIELLVVIIIIAIVVVIAAPNFTTISKRNAVVSTTNELTGLLQYARSSAMVSNMPTIVCPLVSSDDAGKKTSYECVTDEDGFNKATSIGVFKYTSSNDKELIRMIYLPASTVVRRYWGEGTSGIPIVFFSDGTSGARGVGKYYSYFEKDGSYRNETIELGGLLGKDGTANFSWTIRSKSVVDGDACTSISVTSIGYPNVIVGKTIAGAGTEDVCFEDYE